MAVATSTLIIAGATAAAGAYSANQQAQAGKAAGKAGREGAAIAAQNAGAEAGTLMFEAEEARRVSQVNAEKVLVQARQYRSSQVAMAAASGFVTDSGTSAMLQEETDNLARADALAMLFDGGDKYTAGKLGSENIIKGGVSNASQMIKQGDVQAAALQGQATSTFLSSMVSAGAKAYGGISAPKTNGPAVSGWEQRMRFSNKGMGD